MNSPNENLKFSFSHNLKLSTIIRRQVTTTIIYYFSYIVNSVLLLSGAFQQTSKFVKWICLESSNLSKQK